MYKHSSAHLSIPGVRYASAIPNRTHSYTWFIAQSNLEILLILHYPTVVWNWRLREAAIFESYDRQTSKRTNSKNVNEKLFKFYPWCIAYTLNNPIILNLTAIQQMATLLLPLTMAGTYGRIREICGGLMRAHGVYRVNSTRGEVKIWSNCILNCYTDCNCTSNCITVRNRSCLNVHALIEW